MCEIAVENVEKTTKLRRAKLTFKKKIIIFFSRHLYIKKVILKAKLLRLHHDDSFANHFKFKKIRILM